MSLLTVVDRVFLDANVLFSAAYRPTTDLRRLWTIAGIELLTSDYALKETRGGLPAPRHADLHALLRGMTVVATPLPGTRPLPPGLVLPAKDVPIFLAAAAATSTHLLTGDKRHFGAYYGQQFDGVLILPPSTYLRSHP